MWYIRSSITCGANRCAAFNALRLRGLPSSALGPFQSLLARASYHTLLGKHVLDVVISFIGILWRVVRNVPFPGPREMFPDNWSHSSHCSPAFSVSIIQLWAKFWPEFDSGGVSNLRALHQQHSRFLPIQGCAMQYKVITLYTTGRYHQILRYSTV